MHLSYWVPKNETSSTVHATDMFCSGLLCPPGGEDHTKEASSTLPAHFLSSLSSIPTYWHTQAILTDPEHNTMETVWDAEGKSTSQT